MTTSTNSHSSPEFVSEFREEFISAQSFRSNDRETLIAVEYDLVIGAVSWDRRCVSLLQAKKWRARQGILIVPPITDDVWTPQHEARLRTDLAARCLALETIECRKLGLDAAWDQLYAAALRLVDRRRPATILLDISTMSRYFSTGLVAMFIRLGLASRIDCFYAEGRYDAKCDVKEVVFSGGGWERRTVPFLDGHGNPALGWYYLVAGGFEGARTKKILLQEEPDRVGLLIPIPGVSPVYDQKCRDEVGPIITEFLIPPEFQAHAHAADAVAAWRALSEMNQERWDEEQVAYLACGTKPHAIGMALRALVHRHPAVFYFWPERYEVNPVEEAGTFWRYSIFDHSLFRIG